MKAWRARSSSSGGFAGEAAVTPYVVTSVLFNDGDTAAAVTTPVYAGAFINDATGWLANGLPCDGVSIDAMDGFAFVSAVGNLQVGMIVSYDGSGAMAGVLAPFSLPVT